MNFIQLIVGILLGARRIYGSRPFNQMPIGFHYLMTPCVGLIVFLLTTMFGSTFAAYAKLLQTQDLDSFLTPQGIAATILVGILGALTFGYSLTFARHWKVLIDHGLNRPGREVSSQAAGRDEGFQ